MYVPVQAEGPILCLLLIYGVPYKSEDKAPRPARGWDAEAVLCTRHTGATPLDCLCGRGMVRPLPLGTPRAFAYPHVAIRGGLPTFAKPVLNRYRRGLPQAKPWFKSHTWTHTHNVACKQKSGQGSKGSRVAHPSLPRFSTRRICGQLGPQNFPPPSFLTATL